MWQHVAMLCFLLRMYTSLAIKKPMLLILIWSDIFASNIYGLSALHYLPIMAPV